MAKNIKSVDGLFAQFNIPMDNDDNDFCRGYGAADIDKSIENYYENDSDDNNDDVKPGPVDDKAPDMPPEFYSKVDNFLNIPPPTMKADTKDKKKAKAGNSTETKSKKVSVPNPDPVLPKINVKGNRNTISDKVEKSSKGKQEQSNFKGDQNSSTAKAKSTKKSKKEKSPDKPAKFDTSLLNEAFAYTDQLLRAAVIEEAQEVLAQRDQEILQEQVKSERISERSRSAPVDVALQQGFSGVHSNTIGGGGRAAGGSGGGGVVKKLREKAKGGNTAGNTTARSNGTHPYLGPQGSNGKAKKGGKEYSNSGGGKNAVNGFAVATEQEQDSRRRETDFDSLLSNFQNGTTHKKLQKELAQSKQSMAKSEAFMKQLSMEFLGKF